MGKQETGTIYLRAVLGSSFYQLIYFPSCTWQFISLGACFCEILFLLIKTTCNCFQECTVVSNFSISSDNETQPPLIIKALFLGSQSIDNPTGFTLQLQIHSIIRPHQREKDLVVKQILRVSLLFTLMTPIMASLCSFLFLI